MQGFQISLSLGMIFPLSLGCERCCGGVGSENERERGEMGGVSMKISKR